MGNNKIIIAGGGTGGHLFPAIAIGEEIKDRFPKTEIHFVGSKFGLESKVFPVKDLLNIQLHQSLYCYRLEASRLHGSCLTWGYGIAVLLTFLLLINI